MSDWIPIDGETMPPDGRHLVVLSRDDDDFRAITTAEFNGRSGWWLNDPFGDAEITHWMKLPAFPEAP